MKIGSSSLIKGGIVAVVALLVLIPVGMLHDLVRERAQLREQAIASVSRGWGGRQLLGGPVIAIPTTVVTDDGRSVTRDWYVLAESLTLEAELNVQDDRRKLGVYEVPVYVAKVHALAKFDVASKIAALSAGQHSAAIHLDRARLLVPIADARGVRDVKLTGAAVASDHLEPERGFPITTLGVALRQDAALDKGEHTFDLTMEVAGTESLAFLPLAHSTNVRLSGNWADPGFTQGFLPAERHIESGRFGAHWQILDLNRVYGSHWFQAEITDEVLRDSAFGVELVQPVDLYLQTERSVKYAGLFIALSLLTMFLWEHLARRPLHPIQYGLMGLALSVFYLLLLALAEHIGFALAYASAAFALCALLGVYLAGAFRSRAAGSGSGAAFAVVYGLLYLLVTAEDYALLAGALGLFALLATVMVLTRRLDWYRTGPDATDA
ncbi:MAG TPA: cell envelope integrity protein CreD [Steroidobacteraceae bacterium]|nr:cell envelope integrity protein CreD [Steroidobacteraceae bacterium]